MKSISLILMAGCFAASWVFAEEPLRLQKERFGHAAVVVHDALYIFGGTSDDGVTADIERVTPDRTTVETIGVMPNPRYWLNAVTDGRAVYLVGGSTLGELRSDVSDLVERWDPETDTWTTLAPLPEARSHVGLAWHNGRLFAIGGSASDRSRSSRVDIYDPVSNTWTNGAPMPTARECDVVLHKGLIHAVGGYDGRVSLAVHEVYDPEANSWKRLPDLPFLLSAHHIAVVDDSLYTFGHYSNLGRATTLDLTSGAWSLLDIDYSPSRHNDVVFDGSEVWVTGGNTSASPPYLNSMQRFPVEVLRNAERREAGEQETMEVEAAKPYEMNPETEAAVTAWGELLGKINTASISLMQAHEMPEHGIVAGEHFKSFSFDRVNQRFRYNADGLESIIDKNMLTIVWADKSKYMQSPRSGPLSDLLPSEAANFYSSTAFDAMAMVSDDPVSVLKSHAIDRRWTLVPDTNETAAMWIFVGEQQVEPLGSSLSERTTVDPSTGLIRHQSIKHVHVFKREGEVVTNRTVVVNTNVAFDLNQELRGNTFDVAIDETWKRVDSLGDMFDRPDRSRFELSGMPAPDFTLTLLDGTTFRLSDHTGKVVVLDFWATWCGPCVKALPAIQTLYEAVSTQGVVVVGVSTDEPESLSEVRKMVKDKGLTYLIGIDTNDTSSSYFVGGIPCVVLINQLGVVQGREIGFAPNLAETLGEQIGILLDGGSLPSAEPLGDEDIEPPNLRPGRTRMDPRYFEPLWEKDIPDQPTTTRFSFFNSFKIQVPPALLIGESDKKITGWDPANGEERISFARPETEDAPDGMTHEDMWTILRRVDATPLLIRYRKLLKPSETSDRRSSLVLVRESVSALGQDGAEVWNTSLKTDGFSSVGVVPFGKDRDVVVLEGLNGFTLMNEQGEVMVRQRISLPDSVRIADYDGDGVPYFYLMGNRIGAYRLRQ